MKSMHKNQQGLAHLGLILVAVVVIAGIGFAGWKVFSNNKDKASTSTVENKELQEAAKAECDKHNDKDLCKFFSKWELSAKYSMTTTDESGAKATFEVDGEKKSRIVLTGEMSYEVITIDKTTYTKAGDVWYKQTITQPDQDVSSDYKVDFNDPEDESAPAEDKTTYKSLGKEACGSLTCFKYEVVDPSAPSEKQFIWFDDKDYLLRKVRSEGPDGTSEMTFAYSNINISEPSPVKELGPNQYIMPGSTEPVTLPSAAELSQ